MVVVTASGAVIKYDVMVWCDGGGIVLTCSRAHPKWLLSPGSDSCFKALQSPPGHAARALGSEQGTRGGWAPAGPAIVFAGSGLRRFFIDGVLTRLLFFTILEFTYINGWVFLIKMLFLRFF